MFAWVKRVGLLGFLGVLCVFGFIKSGYAAIDLTEVTIDLTSIETLVPIILIAGAAIWVIRKLIKTTNRS